MANFRDARSDYHSELVMRRFSHILARLIFAVMMIVALTGIEVLLFPKQLLSVDSGEVKADAIVVLGGVSYGRPERAAELFKAGCARIILVSGTGDNDQNVRRLEKAGVPTSAIVTEDRSASTKENAQFSIPLLRQMGAHRVIIVTSWFHSRRALACFKHFAPDITFYSRPSYFGFSRGEWNQEGDGGYVRVEFFKLYGYWICYGICPVAV